MQKENEHLLQFYVTGQDDFVTFYLPLHYYFLVVGVRGIGFEVCEEWAWDLYDCGLV